MFSDIVFVALFFIFPIFIYLLYRAFGKSIREVTIPNAVIVSLFVFAYVGIFPLYFYLDAYRYAIGVVDREIILKMFIASSWAIFSITFIVGVLSYLVPVPERRVPGSGNLRKFDTQESFICIAMLLLCSLVFYLYVSAVDEVALFVAIFGGDQSVAAARSSMTNAFPGNYHWYRLFIGDISVFASYCLYANHLQVRRLRSMIIFLLSFFLCCLFLLSTAQKAPVVWYFLGLYLIYAITHNEGFVSIKGVFYSGVIGLVALVALYIGVVGVDGFVSATGSVFSRAFTAGISASYFYFEFFPDHKEFLWGASLPNPGGLLPFDPYPLTKELMAWRFPGNAEVGVVGSSPTVFWGEAFANFSWGGILFLPLMIGVIIYFYHFFVSFLENTPFKVALIVWLVLFFRNIATTGFSTFLINVTFFCFLGVVAFMIWSSNRLVIKVIR